MNITKKKKRLNKDLWCDNCHTKESTTLLYWKRYNPERGKYSIINPSFICDTCKSLFTQNNDRYQDKPYLVSFHDIANKWDGRMMGLTSKKRWQFSCFWEAWFRKKLHRIKFIWKNA